LTIDLAFDDAQQAIETGIGQFCRDQFSEEVANAGAGEFPAVLWRELGELGVFALATPEGEGGAMEIVAACEALGAALFPGPLSHTFLATQLLDVDARAAIVSGDALPSVGASPLWPWGPHASVFIELDGDAAYRVQPMAVPEPVETLGGETWGRAEVSRLESLPGLPRGQALCEISTAAYATAAARHLVDTTADHARTRRQFGRSIGEFQAVAHPLADCHIALSAAEILTREAAFRFDRASGEAPGEIPARVRSAAAAARASARRASVESAHICHQLFGALGITLAGPVFHVSRRILQLAAQLPADRDARETVLNEFGL
jgi:hypothetical protein